MKSIVIMTYYHLIHSIAWSLHIGEKFDIYISTEYLGVKDNVIDRIANTNFFNNVYKLEQKSFIYDFRNDLKDAYSKGEKTLDRIGNRIFEKYLIPYYENAFRNADFNDDLFLYNDHNLYYYYISKNFKSIIGMEDGYKQLENKFLQDDPKEGYFAWLKLFTGKYFPEMHWKNPNIKSFISSCPVENINDEVKQKIQVIDFFDLVKENENIFWEIVNRIFEFNVTTIIDQTSIYFTQALNRSKYCDAIDMFLLDRKVINNELKKGYDLVIKPHPANQFNFKLFENSQVMSISKEIPSEIIDFGKTNIKHAVSFMSTAIDSLKGIKEKETICRKNAKTYTAIKKEILKNISGEKINIDVYLKYDKLNLNNYVNAFTFFRKNNRINFNVNVLMEGTLYNKGLDYFSSFQYKKRLKELKKKKWYFIKRGYYYIYRKMIKKISLDNIKIKCMRSLNDEDIIKELKCSNFESDFFIILDSDNVGVQFVNEIDKTLLRGIKLAVLFNEFTIKGSKKIYLGRNSFQQFIGNEYSNILWHKKVLDLGKEELYDLMTKDENIGFASNIYLLKNYKKIVKCKSYYESQLKRIVNSGNSRDTKKYVAILNEYLKCQKITYGKVNLDELEILLSALKINDSEKKQIYQELFKLTLGNNENGYKEYFYIHQDLIYNLYVILRQCKKCIDKINFVN